MIPRNYNQAHALIERADKLFRRAALTWERGNNNASIPGYYAKCMKRCEKLRNEAEALLSPLGIKCDYPGLYPSFKVNGYDEHSTQNAVSAALGEFKKKK